MDKRAKTDNFLEAIKKHADAQREAMRNEIDQIKEQKIKEAEEKAKYDSEKFIAEKCEAKKHEQTALLAKKTQDGQKKLFLERARMTDNVFKKAEEKLIEFAKTSEYSEKLIQSAKEIASLFGNESCVLYINERDTAYSDKIKALFNGNAEIKADKTVVIGGIKGYCENMNIIADETLDSKLNSQKTWFVENSGLSVL